MILLDSNLVIYAAQPATAIVRDFLRENDYAVSAISFVETLGFHRLAEVERDYLEGFFRRTRVIPLSEMVLHEAVHLRQARKMALGDALVAGTALAHRLVLATHNARDFDWIDGLQVVDPLDGA